MAALTEFELGIIRDHANAAPDASNFDVYWDTESRDYNCFAYAVNITNARITPQGMRELVDNCTWNIPSPPSLHA